MCPIKGIVHLTSVGSEPNMAGSGQDLGRWCFVHCFGVRHVEILRFAKLLHHFITVLHVLVILVSLKSPFFLQFLHVLTV